MVKNRFEQVDDIQPDAITLSLKRDGEGATGAIVFPASASGGRLSEDRVSDHLPARDAFRNAVKLANDMKVPIVVRDPEGLWEAEWGSLYRPVD